MKLQEAVSLGIIPEDVGEVIPDAANRYLYMSMEFLTDANFRHVLRSAPITDEEIADWKEADQWVTSMSMNDRRDKLASVGLVIDNPVEEEF